MKTSRRRANADATAAQPTSAAPMPSTTSGVADAEPDCTAAACCRPPSEGEHGGSERGEPRRDGAALTEVLAALPRRSEIVELLAGA